MEKAVCFNARKDYCSENLASLLNHFSRVVTELSTMNSTKLTDNLMSTLRDFYLLAQSDKVNVLPLSVQLVDADGAMEVHWTEVKASAHFC